MHLHFAGTSRYSTHHGAKGIHHHDAGLYRRDLFDDFFENRVQVFCQHQVAQVDKPDGFADLGFVEERKLLLIAQHLDGGFAEHSEIECRLLCGRVGENELMCHRRFAATGCAGDDVERKFRNAAAHNVVEAAHASWQ